MKTIVEIRDFIKTFDVMTLGQFAADWIEEQLDRIERYLEAEEIGIDDETYQGSVCYQAETILEILKAEAPCRTFFEELYQFTSQSKAPAIIMDSICVKQ